MNRSRTLVITAAFVTSMTAGLAFGQAHDHAHDAPQAPQPAAGQPAAPVANPNPVGPAPKLTFQQLEHDFGRISDEGIAEHKFYFKNEGDAPLRFTIPFRATCGCTAGNPRSDKNPDVDQIEFAPGETGFINISFNAHGKHGDVNQDVFVASNDPRSPETKIHIHAFVRQTIAIEPPLVSFGEVMAGQPSTQIVKVYGPAPDFKVTYATTTRPRYLRSRVIETKEVDRNGEKMNETTIELAFTGNAPRGSLSAMATARTTSDKHPLRDIQISAEVVGDVQVLPPRLNVGILESDQSFTKTFRVSSRTGRSFKVVKVDQSSQSIQPLEITVTPVQPGDQSAYQVEVKGKAPSQAVPIMATLTVVTDVQGDENIQVQMNGAVRAAPQVQIPFAPGMAPEGAAPAPAAPSTPPAQPTSPANPALKTPAKK